MNLYNPATILPVQLQLPLPSLQKTILIYARGAITDSGQQRINTWIGRAAYRNWRVITGDNIYLDLQIASITQRSKINHTTYGITKRPRNNTSTRNYTQFTPYTTQTPNKPHCDRYMVKQADMIICVWDGLSQDTIKVYNYARSFRHKKTFISTHAQPSVRVNGKRPFLRAGYITQSRYNKQTLTDIIIKGNQHANIS